MKSEFDINSIDVQEINDLIVNFKESKRIYLMRKEMGMTFKEFRRMVKSHTETFLNNR